MAFRTIQASFGLDIDPLKSAASKAQTVGERLGQSMRRSLGGISFAGPLNGLRSMTTLLAGGSIVAGLRSIVGYAGQLTDLASAVNLDVETFQKFTAVVEAASGNAKAFQMGMASLLQQVEAAKNGNEKTIETFERLGVSWADLHTLSPDKILLKLSDALHAGGNDGAVTAGVMDLLGSKVALKLIPALKLGSEEFLKLGKSAKIMSNEAAEALDAAGDRWDKFVKDRKAALAGDLGTLLQMNDEGLLFDKNSRTWLGKLIDSPFFRRKIGPGGLEEARTALDERRKNPPKPGSAVAEPTIPERPGKEQRTLLDVAKDVTEKMEKQRDFTSQIARIAERIAEVRLEAERDSLENTELLVSLEKERVDAIQRALHNSPPKSSTNCRGCIG